MYLALFINKTLQCIQSVSPLLNSNTPTGRLKKILYTDIQVRLVVALAVTFFENYSLDNIAVFRNMIGMSVSAK